MLTMPWTSHFKRWRFVCGARAKRSYAMHLFGCDCFVTGLGKSANFCALPCCFRVLLEPVPLSPAATVSTPCSCDVTTRIAHDWLSSKILVYGLLYTHAVINYILNVTLLDPPCECNTSKEEGLAPLTSTHTVNWTHTCTVYDAHTFSRR